MVMQISIRAILQSLETELRGNWVFFHGRRVDKSSIELFRSVVSGKTIFYTFTPYPLKTPKNHKTHEKMKVLNLLTPYIWVIDPSKMKETWVFDGSYFFSPRAQICLGLHFGWNHQFLRSYFRFKGVAFDLRSERKQLWLTSSPVHLDGSRSLGRSCESVSGDWTLQNGGPSYY